MGERAASIYSLISSAKLNGLNPEAYLRNVLERIADHPINRKMLFVFVGVNPMQILRVAEPFPGKCVTHAKENRRNGKNGDGQVGAPTHTLKF